MSNSPHLNWYLRNGVQYGNCQSKDSLIMVNYDHKTQLFKEEIIERMCHSLKITRKNADDWAHISSLCAYQALKKGVFEEEIVPITLRNGEKLTQDETIHPPLSHDEYALAPPLIANSDYKILTKYNSAGPADGGVCLALASDKSIKINGLKPKAKIISWANTTVKPEMYGLASISSARLCLERANLNKDDIDIVEIFDASTPFYHMYQNEFNFHEENINPNGGPFALGHPLSMTGLRMILSATYELHRREQEFAMISLCSIGGMGCTIIIKAVD